MNGVIKIRQQHIQWWKVIVSAFALSDLLLTHLCSLTQLLKTDYGVSGGTAGIILSSAPESLMQVLLEQSRGNSV